MVREIGRIIGQHSNTVIVQPHEGRSVFCRLRGRFKRQKIFPYIGDMIEFTRDGFGAGVVENILPRQNFLTRPKVANVDQVVIITSFKKPPLDLLTLDTYIVLVEEASLDILMVFNKSDLLTQKEKEKMREVINVYDSLYKTVVVSALTRENLWKLEEALSDKVSVFAGVSGVGKSSLLNAISPTLKLKVNGVSKNGRGKHTTTTSTLLSLPFDGFVVDTPGFVSLSVEHIPVLNLQRYFKDIHDYSKKCFFSNCLHRDEVKCEVKKAVKKGKIVRSRYENYLKLLERIERSIQNER